MTYKTEVLEKVYSLLGLKKADVDANKAIILEFTYDMLADEVLNYCHLADLPAELKYVLASMVVDLYRMGDFGKEILTKEPTSITRGDVSVSYKLGTELFSNTQRNSAYIMANMAFMKDYYKQLNAFRKVAW
ncbi:MAG: hypothetical protein ACOX7J_02665 [Bacillota bacterium]|jgi:hypothetical protein